jgi:hypothetical protein
MNGILAQPFQEDQQVSVQYTQKKRNSVQTTDHGGDAWGNRFSVAYRRIHGDFYLFMSSCAIDWCTEVPVFLFLGRLGESNRSDSAIQGQRDHPHPPNLPAGGLSSSLSDSPHFSP